MTDLKALMLERLKEKQELRVSDIVRETGYSRVYVHRIMKGLVDEGVAALVGKANQARYVPSDRKDETIRETQMRVRRMLRNKDLAEHRVLDEIKRGSAIYEGLTKNVASIADYAFTEMLNNAIEHSLSPVIDLVMARTTADVRFEIADNGIGIFNNIMKKRGLQNRMEAIQDLLKGKETTAPEGHSGEGIFFTSKIADSFIIRSSEKKVVFDNLANDMYVTDINLIKGTKVFFLIRTDAAKTLADLFSKYTDESLNFSKTGVGVALYREGAEYVSRSQARRIMTGLDKFESVELDFKGIETVGQAFADEVFRVWSAGHPNTVITPINASENIMFMIGRARGKDGSSR
jgi:hypothetical protein